MGPLDGVRAIEIAGIGPGPFCAMLLSDMGAEVLRVDRAAEVDLPCAGEPQDLLVRRGRSSVAVDLKHPDGPATVVRLCERADILIEGFRPGVAERLAIGPEQCMSVNPRLVYGRMTGWGQTGSSAKVAGHDLNYVAITGALAALGRPGEPPPPPLNLVGDYGGGGMLLALGVLAALIEARSSGKGQVVDAAMADGAALLSTVFYGMRDLGHWHAERGLNLLDGGAPFYDTYETADGKYVSLGSLEPKFYDTMLRVLGFDGEDLPDQYDVAAWPALKERIAAAVATRTRDEWCAAMAGEDACFAPVLTFDEAREYPANLESARFIEHAGFVQPAPAPRFERTPSRIAGPAARPGQHSEAAMAAWGFDDGEVRELIENGAVRQAAAELDARPRERRGRVSTSPNRASPRSYRTGAADLGSDR
jgi:alpha-methylacyl-CoA racemase